MPELRIDMTSDFICPWCFIAEERLKAAARRVDGLQLDLHWHPFELNPTMPSDGMDRRAYRSRKFGSWGRSLAMDEHVTAAGAAAGVRFDFERIVRTPNTRLAHRLTWFAGERGRGGVIAPALFRAYFSEGRDIGRSDELTAIAVACGLDGEGVRDFLASAGGTEEVLAEEHRALSSGIDSVPRIAIGARTLSGAADDDELESVLRRALAASVPAKAGAQ